MATRNWYNDVAEFHRATGQTVNKYPTGLNDKDRRLRISLISEEIEETIKAIWDDDLVEIADGIADSIYVLLGTAVSAGIDMNVIFREVHQNNMLKTTGPKREDGKQLKPEGWEPPRIAELLRKLGWHE